MRLMSLFFALFIMGSFSGNAEATSHSIQEKLIKLEARSKGRLGVVAINTATNEQISYRGEERFPLCSTSKIMTVAAILKNSERHPSLLNKKITYTQKEVEKSGYAPITQEHVAKGMTVKQLCEAAIQYSDNHAMNLLMSILGGPKAVTAYARSIQDADFRLDGWEPELNEGIPGNLQDTTTPSAMAHSLRALVLDYSLAPPQQKQLQIWLKNNTTGEARIRAAIPEGWIVGDKTGTGDYGTTNDIAIIWPSKCPPIVVAVYFTQKEKTAVKQEQMIAQATHFILQEFAKTDPCIRSWR